MSALSFRFACAVIHRIAFYTAQTVLFSQAASGATRYALLLGDKIKVFAH